MTRCWGGWSAPEKAPIRARKPRAAPPAPKVKPLPAPPANRVQNLHPVPDGRGNAARRIIEHSPGPWASWRKMSRHARYIKFIQTYCRPPKGVGHGQPMKLATFQKEFLEEALAPGISTAVMPTPSGNGKSTFGGAIGVAATFMDDDEGEPQVPIIATTVGQAIRSVYGVAAS